MKWREIINPKCFEIADALMERVRADRALGKNICPKDEQIFRALELTGPDKVKVVVVGQDPYHTPGQANGLAFSVAPDAPLQPSLRNIFKELKNDIGCGDPPNGDLTSWAEKGVLLLNTTLTVYEHQPNSHANWGWDTFTSAVLESAVKLPQPIVFILWGTNAIGLKKHLIVRAAVQGDTPNIIKQNLIKKDIIMSSHPSPFSASKSCQGYPSFLGSRPFSTANKLLMERGAEPVDWKL